MENQEYAANFLNFVSNWQTWQNFSAEKAFLRGNLICYASGTEGCRKLKFGEVGLHTCQNFLRKTRAKTFPT